MLLGIIGWICIGLVIGFLASKMVDLRGDGPIIGIAAGTAGAVVGGIVHAIASGRGVAAFDLWSMISAAIGAAAGAALFHFIRSRSISHDRQSVRTSY